MRVKDDLHAVMWNGVRVYFAGLSAVLAAIYVLPGGRISLYVFVVGTMMFIASGALVIASAMALEFVAIWNGAWQFNRTTLVLTIVVLPMAIWLSLILFVWP